MNTFPSKQTANGGVPVWDPLVRIFHWSLVAFFTLAWLTEDELQGVHQWSGYAVAGLVAFRVIWGLIGTRHARFTDFVRAPREIRAYLKSLLTRHPRHYLGHNPAGGAMVVLMLIGLAALTLTGMMLAGADGSGPLSGTWLGSFAEHDVKEVHEFFANLMLLLVFGHVSGVLVSSLLHRENLVRAMISGRKQEPESPQEGGACADNTKSRA
ncbi:MAG: cytochrome b/b6 domain-containing protein [Oceanospirillaceae bacterium]|nr:cytochrome b/b6 domain-containing protein [Oceanospirillaceae bacterium]